MLKFFDVCILILIKLFDIYLNGFLFGFQQFVTVESTCIVLLRHYSGFTWRCINDEASKVEPYVISILLNICFN